MTLPRNFARLLRLAAVVAATVPLAVCGTVPAGLELGPAPEAVSAAAFEQGPITEHLVVVSIDGLRPDAIEKFNAGTLQWLMRGGSYSLKASTIMPSLTLPSHTSMLTGVEPKTHGVTWNRNHTDTHGTVEIPTILASARAAGLQTAAFVSKGKFNHLLARGTVDYARVPRDNGKWAAEYTADAVEDYLEDHRPNLTFVHLGDPDYAGHVFGWMSRPYSWAVHTADQALARIVNAADAAFGHGEYTIIVTADHGGHGRTHGTTDPRDVTIPWIAWGKGVTPGALPAGIHTTDTAATALWLLGVDAPAFPRARAVLAAFGARMEGQLVTAE